ncbi:hypothetical protein [Candidatus Palauibacter sp.]
MRERTEPDGLGVYGPLLVSGLMVVAFGCVDGATEPHNDPSR